MLSLAIGSVLYGLMIRNRDLDQKNMLLISVYLLLVSLLAITLVASLNSANPLFITLALLLFVIGQIIPSTILYPLCLNIMPHAKARVSAIIQGSRLVLSSLALQIAGYFYQGSFKNIGMLISGFILMAIITLFFVIKNYKLIHIQDSKK